MLKRFVAYYRPHKKLFALDMLASLLISVLAMVYPVVTRNMLNDYIPNKNIRMIIIFGIALFVIYFIRMLLRYFVQYYGHIIGINMQAQMRLDMFKKLQKLPFVFFDENETGKIMSRLTSDLADISELAHHGPENLLISGIMVFASFGYLLSINVELTLIVFVCVPLLGAAAYFFRKKMHVAFMESRKSVAQISAAVESSITGIRVTKAFNNIDTEIEKFEQGNDRLIRARKVAYDAMGKFFSSTNFVTDIFNIIVLIAGGLFLYNNEINFGDYSSFIISINLFIGPVMTLSNFMEQYQNASTGFGRFLEIMDEKEEEERPEAAPISNVKGNIEFENVSFAYKTSELVLKDISFKIKEGSKTAFVGPSGGGKTTICHLIPRFYPINEGSIKIDGVDIRNITLDSLRDNIGIVQQDVFLFNGTLRENIMYGRVDATEEEMIEAAKKAEIHDYIMSLPDGYDSQIGERGVKLSGGQKQRISIARIFLKNPAILILDEATSALDNTTEILIQSEFDKLCEGRTTLIVAHRLSTVKNADEIIVISDGKIEERGSHNKLLLENGTYANLYEQQFREED
ncbi:MAG: ABC transporter ATP-binding protein [Oscillospiraceae bacterium]|nr:ABC transporter ATP-binding protein [Oscillospiraceae bacterium]